MYSFVVTEWAILEVKLHHVLNYKTTLIHASTNVVSQGPPLTHSGSGNSMRVEYVVPVEYSFNVHSILGVAASCSAYQHANPWHHVGVIFYNYEWVDDWRCLDILTTPHAHCCQTLSEWRGRACETMLVLACIRVVLWFRHSRIQILNKNHFELFLWCLAN